MQVSPQEYEALERLSPAARKDAVEAVRAAAAGGVPAKVRRELMQQAIERAEAAQTDATAGDYAELEPDDAPLTIAGRPCRPMSAGVIRLLELIRHPMAVDGGGAMELADVIVLLYIMLEPDAAKLLALARAGTLRDEADLWSFGIGPSEIEQMQSDAGRILSALGGSPASPIQEPGEKKEQARSAG